MTVVFIIITYLNMLYPLQTNIRSVLPLSWYFLDTLEATFSGRMVTMALRRGTSRLLWLTQYLLLHDSQAHNFVDKSRLAMCLWVTWEGGELRGKNCEDPKSGLKV